ncbi:MAG TPA: fucose isomerase [Ruminiclostridium sp.]|nr:fucose isomerase [Ruminiclostridium sp.]
MKNIPEVRLGIVAVSRDCFPVSLSVNRRKAVLEACRNSNVSVVEIQTAVENENDVLKALDEIKASGINALCVYLGNFGPEGPETMLAQKFDGPVMFAAAAEETGDNLIDGRGDAYCGMLNACYNLRLRNLNVYIPENPVGSASQAAEMLADFTAIARVVIGVKNLKIFGFGPRPYDFLACNAPIKPLYNLGVEVQENSELDLFASFNAHAGDSRIAGVVDDMAKQLGAGNKMPKILPKLAQYELTVLDWIEKNAGASKFAAVAGKCWPAFQTQFGFVPCYVNSRLTERGIPAACETDIYGALTEYILTCATCFPVTLLDINNTVPDDMYSAHPKEFKGYTKDDVFMGFHCGNTPLSLLKSGEMKYQLIMHRGLEPDKEPDITRGTLEGAIKAGEITLFRLQSTDEAQLTSYIAHGNVIDIEPRSFGGIGVIGVKEMSRFYRYVLLQKGYPHHGGVGFRHVGKILFEALKMLGIEDINFNRPASMLYPEENPFK